MKLDYSIESIGKKLRELGWKHVANRWSGVMCRNSCLFVIQQKSYDLQEPEYVNAAYADETVAPIYPLLKVPRCDWYVSYFNRVLGSGKLEDFNAIAAMADTLASLPAIERFECGKVCVPTAVEKEVKKFAQGGNKDVLWFRGIATAYQIVGVADGSVHLLQLSDEDYQPVGEVTSFSLSTLKPLLERGSVLLGTLITNKTTDVETQWAEKGELGYLDQLEEFGLPVGQLIEIAKVSDYAGNYTSMLDNRLTIAQLQAMEKFANEFSQYPSTEWYRFSAEQMVCFSQFMQRGFKVEHLLDPAYTVDVLQQELLRLESVRASSSARFQGLADGEFMALCAANMTPIKGVEEGDSAAAIGLKYQIQYGEFPWLAEEVKEKGTDKGSSVIVQANQFSSRMAKWFSDQYSEWCTVEEAQYVMFWGGKFYLRVDDFYWCKEVNSVVRCDLAAKPIERFLFVNGRVLRSGGKL